MQSYGSVVFVKEVPSALGIQSCLFEELESHDEELLMKKAEDWLKRELEKGERDIEEGKYISAKEALSKIKERLELQ